MKPHSECQPVSREALAARFEADAKQGCYTLIKYEHDVIIAALRAPVEARTEREALRVQGASDIVDEATCLIWGELCPGMVMGDDDLPHYENAARAVLALPGSARAAPDAARRIHELEGALRDLLHHEALSTMEGCGCESCAPVARASAALSKAPAPHEAPVCCYCDAPLSCARCGREQPDEAGAHARCGVQCADATANHAFMAQEILDFLNSIEGAGYGGMGAFEIVRGYARSLALPSAHSPGTSDNSCDVREPADVGASRPAPSSADPS